MEPLGRKSADSFRSTSSYNQSYRGRSYKKQLERKTNKTRAAEKVRKHNIKKVWNQLKCVLDHWWFFFSCVPGGVSIMQILFACMRSCFANDFLLVSLCLYVFFSFFFFTLPASIYHEWTIKHLWARTGFQLSHHRHSPLTSSYQEAQPESDQWDFRRRGRERQW